MPEKIITNPNGANGSVSDPREQVMWDLYVKNNLENAYKCAIEAGYEEDTAKQITVRRWFIERTDRLRRKDMLSKAEKVLDKTLSYSTENDEGKVMPDILRIQTDVAKHVVSTLGKNEGYSNSNGKEGTLIQIQGNTIIFTDFQNEADSEQGV